MNVERVKVGFGTTINLGNYNSARFDVEFEARLDVDEDAGEAARVLHLQAVDEVKREARERIRRLQEEQGDG